MAILYKQGCAGDLSPIAAKGEGRIAQRCWDDHQKDLVVTAHRNGDHMMGSLHNHGLAFDFRGQNWMTVGKLEKILGKDWQVIYYPHSGHYHAEYDPVPF